MNDDADLQRDIAAMGEPLGRTYHELSNELTWLCWQFQELTELYGGTGARLELMNRAAPFFFWLLQRNWWEEVLLGLSRLLGPNQSARKDNLSFRRLPDLIDDSELRAKVDSAVKSLVVQAAFAMEWRNKHIAHRDLQRALSQSADPLPAATIADVRQVLTGLADVLNTIQRHFTRGTTGYLNSPIMHGVMSMLYVLRDGVRLEDMRQTRASQGEYDPKDWGDGDPAL